MKNGFTIVVGVLLVVIGYVAGSFSIAGKFLEIFGTEEAPVIEAVHDVKTEERAKDNEEKAGENIGIFQKPFETWVKPIKRTEEKASKDFIKDSEKSDLIKSAEVSKSKATFYTYNASDSTVSEFIFENPGRQFSILSTPDGLKIKRKEWYWRTLMVSVEYETKLDSLTDASFKNMKAGLKTRLEHGDNLEFGLSLKHDFKNKLAFKNLILGAEVKGVIIK